MTSVYFKFSFLIFFLIGIFGSIFYVRKNPLEANAKSGSEALTQDFYKQIPQGWSLGSTSHAKAQWSHQLWTSSPDRSTPSLTLDFLNQPDLFSIIFPGYPNEMKQDQKLWSIYFKRDFDQKIQLRKISEFSQYALLIPLPWMGCLDIYEKYGADILLIGASDVAQGLMVDQLSQEVAPSFPKARVLSCTTPGSSAPVILNFIRTLKSLHPPRKVKWTVVGLSPSGFLSTFPFATSLQLLKQDIMTDFKKRKYLGSWESLNQGWSLPITWNDLIPARKARNHLPPETANKMISMTDAIPERWSVHPGSFTRAEINDEKGLQYFLSKQPIQHIFIQKDLVKNECEPPDHIQKLLFQIKEELKPVSDKTLLFLFPTLGYEMHDLPDCFLPEIVHAFEQSEDAQTNVLYKGHADYGLNVTDHIIGDSKDHTLFKIDLVHPNKFGAAKITSVIAHEILRASD